MIKCHFIAALIAALLASTMPAAAQLLRGRQGGNLAACTTLPGNSPDGTVLHSATGGSVKTVYGTFSFGDYYVNRGSGLDPDLYPTLNGRPIENPFGVEGAPITCRVLRVLDCGQLACQTLSSVWNGWSSNSWAYLADLTEPLPWDPLPPSQVTPPFTPSADGTTMTAPPSTITSEDGVWSFGPPASGGGYYLRLNGAAVATAGGTGHVVDTIAINSHGRIWVHDFGGGWDIWQGQYMATFFQIAGAGLAYPPPPTALPIPSRLYITPPPPNLPEYNNTLSASAPINTLIGTLTLYLSDGSTGSCGAGGVVCNIGATAQNLSYATISGNNVVMAVNDISDCGLGNNHSLPLSFTLNGVTIQKLFGVSPVGC